MRILFLTNLFPPMVLGGYERACANVAAGLAGRGHDVAVLTTWSPLPYHDDPPYVDRSLDMRWYVPHRPAAPQAAELMLHEAACSSYANTLALLGKLRSFEPDLVYVWNLFGVGIAACLDLLNTVGVPWALHLMDRIPEYITTNVPPHVRAIFNAGGRELYGPASLIAMSEHLLDEIAEVSGISLALEASIIPGWADMSLAGPHQPYRRGGTTRFVTAGSVNAHKGTDLIVEAAGRLYQAGHRSFHVDIFGHGEIGHYVDFAKGLGVSDHVRFFGSRTQSWLMQAYATYDAFLFPTSEREPFGFAPVEAAACGTVPIMTRNCGASERLVDGVHCLKIERDVEDLAAAMRSVMDGTTDIAAIGATARRMIGTDLSFVSCLDRIEDVLQAMPAFWNKARLADDQLPLLSFVKHELSVSMRFG